MRIIVGAVTGIQGEYILDVPANAKDLTIVTGFVGYVTQKVPYTGQRVYDVRLKEDSKSIQSVVVEGKVSRKNEVGVKRENLGTATEYLDVTQFEDMSVTSVDQMIQGRMANLDIVAASGDPGTVSTIRIRGSASLNSSNEPLIVIDGIPQDNEIDEDFNFGDANVEDFGALLSISPNDIQSIEILKDAAATALWGPRAANGVILIVTKQGGVHKPRFSFSPEVRLFVRTQTDSAAQRSGVCDADAGRPLELDQGRRLRPGSCEEADQPEGHSLRPLLRVFQRVQLQHRLARPDFPEFAQLHDGLLDGRRRRGRQLPLLAGIRGPRRYDQGNRLPRASPRA